MCVMVTALVHMQFPIHHLPDADSHMLSSCCRSRSGSTVAPIAQSSCNPTQTRATHAAATAMPTQPLQRLTTILTIATIALLMTCATADDCWEALGACLNDPQCNQLQAEFKHACYDAVGKSASYQCHDYCLGKIAALERHHLGLRYRQCWCPPLGDPSPLPVMLCRAKMIRVKVC